MKEDAGEAPSQEEQGALLSSTFIDGKAGKALLETLLKETVEALEFIVTGMWAHVGEEEKEDVEEELAEEDTEAVTQATVDEFKTQMVQLIGPLGVDFPAGQITKGAVPTAAAR
jgi:hypothetical protein